MSGQPYRYAKDIENFRDNYMEALGLRANLDDMNLQANKIYKATGTIPPKSTAMIDGRTTAEILMDTEKLKLSLYSELKPICNSQMAQLVVQRVLNSPLNADGSFLVWFAQNASELVTNLKRKYKFGIAGDSNDAEQMVLFLQNIYSKTKDMTSSVKTAFDRPAGDINIGSNIGSLDALLKLYDEISYRLLQKLSSTMSTTQVEIDAKYLLTTIRTQFDKLTHVLDTDRYETIKEIFLTTSSKTTSMKQASINQLGYQAWIEFTDKVPSVSSLRALLDQLTKSEKNKNPSVSVQILQNISSILPSISDTENIKRITDNIIHTNGIVPPTAPSALHVGVQGNYGQAARVPAIEPRNLGTTPGSTYMGVIGSPDEIARNQNIIMGSIIGDIVHIANVLGRQVGIDSDEYKDVLMIELDHIENVNTDQNSNWEDEIHYDRPTMIQALYDFTHGYDLNYIRRRNLTVHGLRDSIKRLSQPNTMVGAGIKKRLGRPKGSGIVKPISERIDKTKGITQGAIHVPFGKYIINKNKLDNDILLFKHNKGYGIVGYPMKKVSNHFGNVMRTIAGGGIPKFDALDKLTEEEKVYLHKVSEKAGILDKLSIPQPSKDQLEKDIHQFEVMKGEILAGNDSPEVIKKFKLILLKLTKTGTLPKREGMEMMQELLSLGF